jgi:hypothetical protein
MAFIRSFFPTSSTIIVWRAGISNAIENSPQDSENHEIGKDIVRKNRTEHYLAVEYPG